MNRRIDRSKIADVGSICSDTRVEASIWTAFNDTGMLAALLAVWVSTEFGNRECGFDTVRSHISPNYS